MTTRIDDVPADPRRMRVFVTGGNGFIGSVTVRLLITAGYQVVCLLRPTSDTARIADLPFARVFGDVRDGAVVEGAMRDCGCTIHLAGPGGWDDTDAAALADVIEGGARSVLNAAATLRGHRVVIVSTTAAVNGSDVPRLFNEQTAFSLDDPSLVYSQAKHRADELALAAFHGGVPVVTVNPAEVYGPNDTAMGTAQNLVDFATSTPVLVCDGGTSVVHVDDVATGIVAALERGRPGDRYILGGDNVTIRELAKLVVDARRRRTVIVRVPNAAVRVAARVALRFKLPVPFNPHVVPYATRYWFMDNAKARDELGLTFRGARETVEQTLEWLAETGRLRGLS